MLKDLISSLRTKKVIMYLMNQPPTDPWKVQIAHHSLKSLYGLFPGFELVLEKFKFRSSYWTESATTPVAETICI